MGLLSEARELLEKYASETYPALSLYKSTRDWLARYEQRKEIAVTIESLGNASDATMPFMYTWRSKRFRGTMWCGTREEALADARRVADELGLKMKVEGE